MSMNQPEIYIIRDGARPQYGAEVPAQTWRQHMDAILGALRQYQTASPAYMPFPAGTPTVEARGLAADQAYKQASLALRQASAATGSQGPKPTQTERDREALAEAYDAVDQALSQGLTPEQVRESVKSQLSELTRKGVDVDQVLEYLDAKAMDAEALAAEEERGRLAQRPWWQKAIDVVVPGAQYR